MTIPLRHFVVGTVFLLLGGLVGLGTHLGVLAGRASLAHVHLLLVGWVCVTIMGAMTQFVPVWSGVSLHSRSLAATQLWVVAVGLVGFAGALLFGWDSPIVAFGALMAIGLWTFVYNVGRTLLGVESYDVTERHFALALAFFGLLTGLGLSLAVDFVYPVFERLPVARSDVVAAHATLAVFGAILTTVLGALYQLATMFTQTELHGIDLPIRRIEEVGYPIGVLALATGRLLEVRTLGILGGLLIVGCVFGYSVLLARRLYETQVDRTPMLSRYGVLAGAMAAWAVLTAPAWLGDPLARSARFGAPGAVHLLTIGVVGFVVLGTLYHVVPFIVWVHRYSDLLGYEPVPMIDDLYSDRLAKTDFVAFVCGGSVVVAGGLAPLPDAVTTSGGLLLLAGTGLFVWNLLGVIREHGPGSVAAVFGVTRRSRPAPTDRSSERRRS